MPVSFAFSIASSMAVYVTTCPNLWFPSKRAMEIVSLSMVTSASGSMVPAFRPRIYCGNLPIPWDENPLRSASIVTSATIQASSSETFIFLRIPIIIDLSCSAVIFMNAPSKYL